MMLINKWIFYEKLKNNILIIVVILTIIFANISAMAEKGITVTLDGKVLNFDVLPQIIDGRTMVPMRTIFEAIGATVDWYEENLYIVAKKDNMKITMQIENTIITKNGKAVILDVPPQLVNDTTMVPVRVIAESFNSEFQGTLCIFFYVFI